MRLLDSGHRSVLAFERASPTGEERVVVLVNFGPQRSLDLDFAAPKPAGAFRNLVQPELEIFAGGSLQLPAGGFAWLRAE